MDQSYYNKYKALKYLVKLQTQDPIRFSISRSHVPGKTSAVLPSTGDIVMFDMDDSSSMIPHVVIEVKQSQNLFSAIRYNITDDEWEEEKVHHNDPFLIVEDDYIITHQRSVFRRFARDLEEGAAVNRPGKHILSHISSALGRLRRLMYYK